ncbi:hypothetical protein BAUCODRAFT_467621 [Baudoinia panamericana UAMH 10762]|uniref:Uncharacterized protein n=1 Tax=Baudoinia panamericana (strain UAMH 10762) TaxID=717646 RepID=M2NBG1_BAUPA|nr:uncharacterized protein BAUCODRAFT_467621 [Baudoinia panamericana UAMH 10762]EMC96235.1 hypothetical protein BAUCODRAFT_467621 [Baudoinia panamericana UAMH 10762]
MQVYPAIADRILAFRTFASTVMDRDSSSFRVTKGSVCAANIEENLEARLWQLSLVFSVCIRWCTALVDSLIYTRKSSPVHRTQQSADGQRSALVSLRQPIQCHEPARLSRRLASFCG